MSWKLVLTILVVVGVAVVVGFRLNESRDSKKSPALVGLPKRREAPLEKSASHPARPRTELSASSASGALPPATSSTDRPLSGTTIVVDPGHNGGNASHPEEIARLVPAGVNGTTKACNTTGTETNDGTLTEAQFNWDVAMDLVPRLEALGADVVLTRHSNAGVGPCVNKRAAIANRAHAAVDVAIHADGNEAEGAQGFDVIHATTAEMVAPAMAGPSLRLAEDIRNALVQSGVPPANYVGDEGLDARSDLAGLNLARVPAVLVELGNMRSAAEAAKLEDPTYRLHLAKAIAVGIVTFLHR
ncbi:MAG: N-acetylmuramoyl-L-alanine amidase [Solirubrobacterales bacterium]